jgi:hypothetical protein
VNTEIYAEWLRRQGHQVIRTASSYWFDAGMRVFQAFPFHWLIEPSPTELRKLMFNNGVVAVRYSTALDSPDGMVSYHVVLKNPYNLEMLHHQARTNVRRGLSQCQIERIPFEKLAKEGWMLQQDTLERQGRSNSMSEAEWRRICLAAEGLPGFEAWGATVDGELAASLLTTRIDDTCCVPYAQSHHKYLNMRVNNALFYAASCDMLSREGVSGIFFSLHSLDAPESVNEFKFRMSFIPKPVRQRVVFHPFLAPFANRASHKAIIRMQHRYPGNNILSKAEGMLRFYLQGKCSLIEQDWPECLEVVKASILESLSKKISPPIASFEIHDQHVDLQLDS